MASDLFEHRGLQDRLVSAMVVVLDIIEAILLAAMLTVIWPTVFFRARLSFGRIFRHSVCLVHLGLLAALCRSLINFRLGRIDPCITILESAIGTTERHILAHADCSRYRQLLEDLYAYTGVAYLYTGHIDDVALCLIRAHKFLGIDRLAGIYDFDFKTAQIVRAGIAAGRLIDDGAVAAFIAKPQRPEPAREDVPNIGKVIPFPQRP